jgi:hypothetical protein
MSDAWIVCVEELRALAERLRRLAGDGADGRAADLAIKMFGTTMGAYLQHLSADPVHPAFLPSAGYYSMYGSPNPDTTYRTAAVDDRGEYLISGYRGSAPDVSVMPFGGPTAQGLETFAAFDLGPPASGPERMVQFTLSRHQPSSAETWWPLAPGTRSLMLRTVSQDWAAHSEPRLAITRLDVDPRRTRPAAEQIEQRLRYFAKVVEAMVMSGVNRVTQLRADGMVNRLIEVDYSANGGLGGQWYHEGCFSLDGDQMLLLEVRLLQGCEAFSLSLTDAFFSTIDWANAQSSLNQRQAVVDADGVLRVVVATSDPGVHNWLDTTGHEFGVMQLRWMGGVQAPEVTVKPLSASGLDDLLASGVARTSPQERVKTLRARQVGVQLRALL